MPKYLHINALNYEVLKNQNNGDCFIKDKQKIKYYFKKDFSSYKEDNNCVISVVKFPFVRDIIYIFLSTLSIILLFYLLLNTNIIFNNSFSINLKEYCFMVLFLIFNIILHEFSHYITLKLYNRQIGKIGFKFNFIFPSFYVNTSDSYMLIRLRKFFVYYSGIMSNIICCSLLFFLFPNLIYLLRLVIWGVLLNLLPISSVRTDGYNIIVNILFNLIEYKGKKRKVFSILQGTFIAFVAVMFIVSLFKLLEFI